MAYKIRSFNNRYHSIEVEYDDGTFTSLVLPIVNDRYPTGNDLNSLVMAAKPDPDPDVINVSDILGIIEPDAGLNLVPSVTAAQAKVALYRHNLLGQVENIIEQYPEDVKIWYNNALIWERNNPYVLGLALELGIADSYVDDLFVYASKLDQ